MNTIEAVVDLIEMGAVEPEDVVKCLRSALQNDTAKDWQGLTRQEFLAATQGLEDLEDCWMAIEAKLKEKNNG